MRKPPQEVHTADNRFQHVEVLKRNRNKRMKYREFFVEGVKCINAALDNCWDLTGLYFPMSDELSQWASDVLQRTPHCPHYALAPELMAELSEKEDGSELVATVRMPEDDISRIVLHDRTLLVVLDRPASPGNLGTAIRFCDVFGVDGIIVTGHAADVYHPQAVRGTMGALFARPVVRLPSQNELMEWLCAEETEAKAGKITLLGTSAKADMPVSKFQMNGSVALVMGNETRGMSRAYSDAADTLVNIPQHGYSSSLNVSCALSVLLYELRR
jgi:TrmH family RNA methyltransferase